MLKNTFSFSQLRFIHFVTVFREFFRKRQAEPLAMQLIFDCATHKSTNKATTFVFYAKIPYSPINTRIVSATLSAHLVLSLGFNLQKLVLSVYV